MVKKLLKTFNNAFNPDVGWAESIKGLVLIFLLCALVGFMFVESVIKEASLRDYLFAYLFLPVFMVSYVVLQKYCRSKPVGGVKKFIRDYSPQLTILALFLSMLVFGDKISLN